MKEKMAPLIVALLFLSALIISDLKLVKGQAAPMDKRVRLSGYGVVLGIAGPNSKEVTLEHEGYAVAYRIKEPTTGKEEDRLAYAFGSQQVGHLESVTQSGTQAIVRTNDGALEITSEARWDGKLNELITWRSVKVTATTNVVMLAIESHADAVRQANYVAQVATAVQITKAALLAGPGLGDRVKKCDCPPCPTRVPCSVGFRLASGGFRASLNMVKSADDVSALIAGGAGIPKTTEMSKDSLVNVLSWKRDVNIQSEPIAPGGGLTAFTSYKIKFK